MLKLKSTTNTTPQSQNPNSLNPNCDHPLEDPLYFDIANYLVFDEDFGSNHNISCEKSQGVVDCSNGSFTSPPFANNMPRRVVDKYKAHEDCRFAFRTKTQLEVMDDGYKWRKYGKKMVKNSPNPRNYFKCSSGGCKVKKRVERDCLDSSYVITTYQGTHNHASSTYYCTSSAI
ncbi:probable WRKY transcription factor 50 isoform X2 [Salvia hispanica]|uniref:probable WRKY transcription factor 50 isoform X2 n=1 Tax=Salvia hispanica TaxID=49212 RepID=UPI002009C172|nr:probable WRKY transcription factor 50 isoform X2 [Salvia hispanica]